MAVLVRSGRTALAASLLLQPIHLAWGEGDPAWDATPQSEPTTATALVAEFGRHALTESLYVMNEPDFIVQERGPPPDGTELDDWVAANQDAIPAGRLIVVPSGRYVELNPGVESNELYVRFQFDYEDGATPPRTVREIGVFIGTVVKPAVVTATPGKMYFEPAELANPGRLLALQRNSPGQVRAANVRQSYELVLEL